MVQKFDSKTHNNVNIKADIIILGCSLPGIVTAHKLKKKFGNTMNIMVLDLAKSTKNISKCNVVFQEDESGSDSDEDAEKEASFLIPQHLVARHYLTKYAKEFNIPLPDILMCPETIPKTFNKLFEDGNGDICICDENFHDFDYVNMIEKFELNQYQSNIDSEVKSLFHTNQKYCEKFETMKLLHYDQTTMEEHICDNLFFTNSREIMRNIVKLVCGAPTESVSVLFYLHQCYRTTSAKNHLDGCNTKFREKLMGYCRKRLTSKLQQSVSDITQQATTIKLIRTFADEKVILETMKGDINYVCNLLAMALRPDELHGIKVETRLMSNDVASIWGHMKPGRAKKFMVQYEENFWRREGYSGDLFSIRGPIIWAMERPILAAPGKMERYAGLIGFLKITENEKDDSKNIVLEHLVKLFGPEAATPVTYKESNVADVFIPQCGDFIRFRKLTRRVSPRFLEWGALDVFGDGDVASALEAGHRAYVHLMSCLRPQAQTFEDMTSTEYPVIFRTFSLQEWISSISIMRTVRLTMCVAAFCAALKIYRFFYRKS